MDRRDFLTANRRKKTKITGQNTSVRRVTSGINPYSGPWTDNEITHLLKRTMFGAKRNDIIYFRGRSISQAVDELLNPTAPQPSPPVKEYQTSTTPGVNADGNITQGTTWVNDINSDGTVQSQRRASYKKWMTGNLVNQDRSIREKMILFWIDHFGNEATDVGNANWIYAQHALIRQYALGNFKAMVDAITKDVAMLRYLNGYLNIASAPDENYGRELMELFTIGKGPDSKYTENDVKEAAKVLTGWQINGTTYTSFFNANRHSTTNKTFSSFFNNTVITGRTGSTAGQLELNDLWNMIFATQESAKFIVRKLYRFFVYYTIDATIEANVITPLADIFRANNYEIKPVLSALFKSEHFFDALNQSCLIKPPVDHVIGCMREFGVVFPDKTAAYQDAYNTWDVLVGWMSEMNQDIGDPPDVSGWQAYYQAPQFHEIWINSDTLPKRNQFTDAMIAFGFTQGEVTVKIDALEFTKKLSNPSDPNALVNDAVTLIYRMPISDTTKQMIKQQILLSNQTSDYYWTNAWNAYLATPTDPTVLNVINTRLKGLYQYLMDMAEYQLS